MYLIPFRVWTVGFVVINGITAYSVHRHLSKKYKRRENQYHNIIHYTLSKMSEEDREILKLELMLHS